MTEREEWDYTKKTRNNALRATRLADKTNKSNASFTFSTVLIFVDTL
jgi:hypothetical protein